MGLEQEDHSHSLNKELSWFFLNAFLHGVTFLAFGNGAPDVFSAVVAFSDPRTAGLAIGALFGMYSQPETLCCGLLLVRVLLPFLSVGVGIQSMNLFQERYWLGLF